MNRSAALLMLVACLPGLGCPSVHAPVPSGHGSLSPSSSVEDAAAPSVVETGHTAPDPSDADDHGGPYAETVRADVRGATFGGMELWHDPSTAARRGTVLVLGHGETGKPSFFEMDVARATLVAVQPINVRPDSGIEMTRVGDLLHLGVQEDSDFLWITYDLSLTEVRRVALPGMGGAALHDRYDAFGVGAGHAVVSTHTAVAYVFDEKGRRTGRHDCRPLLFVGSTWGRVAYADGLAVIKGLDGSQHNQALCGFSADGSGMTLEAEYDPRDDVFDVNGHLYLYRHLETFLAIGKTLRPIDGPVADPRPMVPQEHCRVTGDFPRRDVWAWGGVDVVLTGECCGGGPAGLFFCSPGGMSPPPAPGTRGFFGPGMYPRVVK